jgi:hypothetical protein
MTKLLNAFAIKLEGEGPAIVLFGDAIDALTLTPHRLECKAQAKYGGVKQGVKDASKKGA